MAALTGKKPKTIIIGVQPKDVSSWSMELSNELLAVIPRVQEFIFEELNKNGAAKMKLEEEMRTRQHLPQVM